MGTNNPHDSLFREVLSRPHLAADQLRAVLPPELVAQLDLGQIRGVDPSFIAQTLGTYQADLLFEVPWAESTAYVYVLNEHQSTVERFMSQRLLRYMSLIWDRHRKTHEGVTQLPPLVPVLIYQGGQRWTAATAFDPLVEYPAGQEALLRPHTPQFEYVLDDLSKPPVAALRARSKDPLLVLSLLLLRLAQEEQEAFLAAALGLVGLLNQIPDQDDRVLIIRYILVVSKTEAKEAQKALADAVAEPVKEAVMTAAEQLQDEARVIERRQNLETVLRARFGELSESTLARLREASGEQLAAWLPRSGTANTLDEVFGKG